MPRYEYECSPCHLRKEVMCSWESRPASLVCPQCGGEASAIVSLCAPPLVRNQPYKFDPKKTVASNGARFGRTPEEQHRHYKLAFDTQRKLVNERRRTPKATDDGWQYLGGMPGEMADSITEQEGDKEILYRDPVTFLKKNDLYMGD